MSYPKFRKNISHYDNTIGNLFSKNRDDLLSSTSVSELKDKVKLLFDQNNVNTPKSREILFKLEGHISYSSALIYVQNIIFASMGMATY